MRKTDLFIYDRNICSLFHNQVSKTTTILEPYISNKAVLSKAPFNIAFYSPDSKEFLYNTEEYNMCKYPEELNNMIINEGIEFRKNNSCNSFNPKTAEELIIIKKLFEKLRIQGKDLTELTGDLRLKTENLIRFEMRFKVFQKWLCENKKIEVYNDEENHVIFKSLDKELFDVESLETHDNLLITEKGLEFIQNSLFDIYCFFYCSNIFGRNCSHLCNGVLFGKIRKKAIKADDGRELDVFESGNFSYVLFSKKTSEEEAYLSSLKEDTEYFLITNDGKTNGSYEATINKSPKSGRFYIVIDKLATGDKPFMSLDDINAKSCSSENDQLESEKPQEEREFVKQYRKSLKQWNAKAMFNLGVCYEFGDGVTKDEKEAVKWYRESANLGNAEAMLYLGDCYLDGTGVDKVDKKEAVKWYQKSADRHFPIAQYKLGLCYDYGIGVDKVDKKEAVKWYQESAKRGCAEAQLALGISYQYGRGIEENRYEAKKWYCKSAKRGNVKAKYYLAEWYYHEKDVDEDDWKAQKLYFEAAEQEDDDAQYSLGSFYEHGCKFILVDEKKAVEWYSKSAKQGNAKALLALGRCYEDGIGVDKKDAKKAVNLYQQSMEKGSVLAKYRLGRCYYRGIGVLARDTEKALELFNESVEELFDGDSDVSKMFKVGWFFGLNGFPDEKNNRIIEKIDKKEKITIEDVQ